MPINVFGNSNSNDNNNKIDTSKFVQKSYLRSNYIETDLDHDINFKNQYRIINLPDPINNKDGVNKIYIDNKIGDIIKRNVQNDDYISFLDNDNVEYKLIKYRPKKSLTKTILFNRSRLSDEFVYYYKDNIITNIFINQYQGTPNSWLTGPLNLYENLPYLSIHTYYMIANTECEIIKDNIHNISKIDFIYNRYSNSGKIGEFRILYKNKDDKYIESLKFSENDSLTLRNEWISSSTNITECNYGVKITFNKKNSVNEIMGIAKFVFSYTI